MNILVTGANGQLGRCMRLVAESSPDRFIFTDVVEAEGLETVHLDITSLEDVRTAIALYSIDAVVNCAAYTNVEAAEDNYDLAELLNARAPENLALAVREAGGLLVHISTDYVFGKEPYNTPCREDMKGTPTGVYGLTKLHGEEAIKSSGCSYVIIRTAWLYSEYGKNFVKTMLALTSSRPSVQVVFDQVGTPTYARDLADAIAVILSDYASASGFGSASGSASGPGSSSGFSSGSASGPGFSFGSVSGPSPCSGPGPCPGPSPCSGPVPGPCSVPSPVSGPVPCPGPSYSKSGVYHYSNEGVCSWYDFASAIAELTAEFPARVSAQSHIQHPARVSAQSHTPHPVQSPAQPRIPHPVQSPAQSRCRITPCHSSEFPSRVTRPAYSVLDKTLIKSTFGVSIPYWRDSLLTCLSNLLPPVEG